MADSETSQSGNGDANRDKIAKWIILGSFGFIGFFLIIIVVLGELCAINANLQHITGLVDKYFNILIPLIGTWMGAVIAYYFSEKNFDRASQSVNNILEKTLDDRLKTISVTKVMIPKTKLTYVTLDQSGDVTKTKLIIDIIKKFNSNITRLPILASNESVKHIIHQSIAHKFISEKIIAGGPAPDLPNLTLGDLLAAEEYSTLAKAIAFVSENSSLADAKKAMENVQGCQDVFITANGSPVDPVKGYLSNVDIAKHSRA